ncbi:MAG TPA: hypothetical protein VJY39_09715 [Acidisphaera sp.]|nr:hypothetical protein [Acidisphaera sp.]
MTGFLNLDLLRAHEVPDPFRLDAAGVGTSRPRIVAERHIAPDGRPVCRWRPDEGEDPSG